jgi:hypothetical protein
VADRAWALLHDAPEAYLIDLARPVKHAPSMEGYRTAEYRLMRAVAQRFGLRGVQPVSVTDADNRMLMTEAYALMTMHPQWAIDAPWEPYGDEVIEPMTPRIARLRFLAVFNVCVDAA